MNHKMVIGLDGFEPTLLEKWKEDLPNLKKLIETGVYSRLKSTTPLGSGPSWTSFATGKNPWNHGVYGLWHRHAGGRPYRSEDVNSGRIWNYLNKAGYRTGIVNIAVTYP